MATYIRILRFLGLKGVISKNILIENDFHLPTYRVRIDQENNVDIGEEEGNISVFHKYCKLPLNGLYFALITAALLWTCAYAVYKALKEKEPSFITLNIFELLFLSQYIYGLYYYQKDQFTDTIKKFREKEIVKYIDFGFILGLVLSFLLSSLMIILIIMDVNMNIFSEVLKNKNLIQKIFIYLAILISKFYSFGIFFSNAVIFSATFISHSKDIENYVQKLENYLENKGETIRSIIGDFGNLKSEYKNSVVGLNNIFASILVLGCISAYFITVDFDSPYISPFHYVQLGCLLVNVLSYLVSITKVKNSVGDIGEIINSDNFDTVFLEKKEFAVLPGDIQREVDSSPSPAMDEEDIRTTLRSATQIEPDNVQATLDYIKGISMRSMIRDLENSNTNDFQILTSKLGASWETFKVFGYEIDDATIFSKLIALGLLFYAGLGIGEKFGFSNS